MPPTLPTLAALSFADPLMLAGLLAAAIPLALHLLNRIRSPIVPFPTLRFLKITAQKTSRRRQVQQYFLLLLRMAVFALIAMAIAHPLIRGGSSSIAYAFLFMLLLGIALLVLATIWGSTAIDKRKSRPASADSPQPTPPAHPTRHLALAAVALLLAIGLTGFSVFGLSSNTFFSGDAGIFSGRSTAAVILLDNSHSMLARRDGITRLDAAKKEIRRLLVETLRPAQAAILATNPPATPTSESLTTDTTALVGSLDHLAPAGRAHPLKERLHTALDLLAHSTDANKMLILVSDLAGPAFADADLFSVLKESRGGGMHDLQIVLMPPGGTAPVPDVGIASFTLAEGSGAAVLGSEITFEAQLLNNGDTAAAKDWELLIDGQPVPSTATSTVQLNPATTTAGRATIRIPYRLGQAGPHAFTLRLKDSADAMEWDDTRTLVLNVAEQARVLVLGADPTKNGPRPRSAAFFFQAALAPFEGGTVLHDAAGKPLSWAIKPEYRSIDDITTTLAGSAAVFLCDVPKISPRTADALQKYVATGDGGRLVWILGPSVDSASYNNTLLPRGLLPAALKDPVVSAAGDTLDWVDLQSNLFASLFDNQEPFRTIVVTGRWTLATADTHARTLAKLSDNTPLLLETAGPGNVGDIYTLLTSPGAAWSNLGSTVVMVPLASRMALGDSGRSKTPLSYDAGDTALVRIPAAESLPPATLNKLTLDITNPANAVLNVRPAIEGNTVRWPFDQTQAHGLYHWRSVDGKHAGLFAVNPPAEEVDLHPSNAEELAREAGVAINAAPGHAPIVATGADDLLAQLDKRSEGTSLTPGVLAMVMILAVIEALMANRYRPAAPIESVPRPAALEPATA